MKMVLSMLLAVIAGVTSAANRYVDCNRADDSGDGSSWDTAKKTIQAAIDIAGKNDTVLIAAGTYLISKELTMSNSVNKHIELRGATGNPADVIVDAQRSCPCLVSDAAIIVSSITFQNGRSIGTKDIAGGITAKSKSFITNCVVRACYHEADEISAHGGGLYLSNSSTSYTGNWPDGKKYQPAVVDTIVEGCAVAVLGGGDGIFSNGGGAYLKCYNTDGLTVRNCAITNFSESTSVGYIQGGGAYLNCGTHRNNVFINCSIERQADVSGYLSCGAGAYVTATSSSPGSLSDSLFAGNSSHGCGGGLGIGSCVSVDRCSVVSNRLSHAKSTGLYQVGGAGIYVYEGNNSRISNTLVADNISTNESNAVEYAGAVTAVTVTNLVIRDCVVRDNVLQNAGAFSFVSAGDLVVSNCVMSGNVATDEISAIRFYTTQGDTNRCGMALITDCHIVSNSNPRTSRLLNGGGILRYGGSLADNKFCAPLTVRNCLFAGNSAENGSKGWGIRATFGETGTAVCDDLLTFDHCTFARNKTVATTENLSDFQNFVAFSDQRAAEHTVFNGCVFWENRYFETNGTEKTSYIHTTYLGATFTHCYADVTNEAFVVTAENGNMGPDGGDVKFANPGNLDFRLDKGSCLIDKGGEFADWMGTGRRSSAHDMGAGYVIGTIGKYGVTVSRNQSNPRRCGIASDIGCCELWWAPGLIMSVK